MSWKGNSEPVFRYLLLWPWPMKTAMGCVGLQRFFLIGSNDQLEVVESFLLVLVLIRQGMHFLTGYGEYKTLTQGTVCDGDNVTSQSQGNPAHKRMSQNGLWNNLYICNLYIICPQFFTLFFFIVSHVASRVSPNFIRSPPPPPCQAYPNPNSSASSYSSPTTFSRGVARSYHGCSSRTRKRTSGVHPQRA